MVAEWIAISTIASATIISLVRYRRVEQRNQQKNAKAEGALAEKVDNVATHLDSLKEAVENMTVRNDISSKEVAKAINQMELHCAEVSGSIKTTVAVHGEKIKGLEKRRSSKTGGER